MIQSLHLKALQAKWLKWFNAHVWTTDTLFQSVALAGVFLLAWLFYRFTTGKIAGAINNLNVSAQIKRILHNMRRFILPFTALLLMYFVRLAYAMELIPGKVDLIVGASSLLIAWIVIRLAVEVIRNSFLRSLFAFSIWAVAALSILGVLDETIKAMDALGMSIGGFRLSALSVTKGLLALSVLLYAATFLSSLVERRIRRTPGLTPSSRVLIGKMVRILLVTIALVIGITSAGIDLSLLAVFSGAVGLGVGFGLQKVVSNLFSGMLLLLDRSITPGDIIELPNGAFGWVEHMGARYTEIVTRDNKSYLIPNEDFITQQVVNWSHGDTLIRLEVKFGVHYNSNPHQVKAVAEEAAKTPERVVSDPGPVCHLVEFGDSSMNFALRFWIKDAQKGVTNMRGEVMLALWTAFKENGILIPYPHREVFLHDAGPVKKSA